MLKKFGIFLFCGLGLFFSWLFRSQKLPCPKCKSKKWVTKLLKGSSYNFFCEECDVWFDRKTEKQSRSFRI